MEIILLKPISSSSRLLEFKKPKNHRFQLFNIPYGVKLNSNCFSFRVSASLGTPPSSYHDQAQALLVREFDPKIPIEEALTPPSSWYTDPCFYDLEIQKIFYRGWQPVGKNWNLNYLSFSLLYTRFIQKLSLSIC